MDLSVLHNIGLTKNEITVYEALLRLGPARAGELIHDTGLQNSAVHLGLLGLSNKGLTSFVRQGNAKLYQAGNPKEILRIADERRDEIARLLPKLAAKQRRPETHEAEVYEGLNGLKTMCYKLIEDAEPGDEFLFLAFTSSNEKNQADVYQFYREYTDIRMRRGLKLRGIAPRSYQTRFESLQWPHQNIVYVDFPTLHNISICNNKVIMVPWENRRVSFLINSKPYADDLRAYFNSIWEAVQSTDEKKRKPKK